MEKPRFTTTREILKNGIASPSELLHELDTSIRQYQYGINSYYIQDKELTDERQTVAD
jgi:hypothetical protein